MGVVDDLKEIEGLIIEMLVVFGENEVLIFEDFVGCVMDDLIGYDEGDGEEC